MSGDLIWNDLERIRGESPLVHNITSYVVMNASAGALLAVGASPVMTHALGEVEDLVAIARALVLDIGTVSSPWTEAMLRAGDVARRRGVPVVLDPAGAGTTRLRNDVARRILDDIHPSVIRGSASEIVAVAGAPGAKGVDGTLDPAATIELARALARRAGCVVAVGGPNVIVSADAMLRVHNGHPLAARVPGFGSTTSALTGAFLAVNDSPLEAAAHAMALCCVAAEIAGERASGPGSFPVAFLDVLGGLDRAELARRVRLERA